MNKAQARTRQLDILDAATRVFLNNGYYITSIDEVAKQAGVSKPTIYKYFESKEELFRAVVRSLSERFTERLAVLDLNDMPPAQGLKQFAQTYLSELLKPTIVSLYRIVLAESYQFPELVDVFFNDGCNPVKNVLLEFLDEQHDKGTMHCPDAALVCDFFYGMIQKPLFWPLLMKEEHEVPSEERIAMVIDKAVVTLMAGFGADTNVRPLKA